VTAVAATSNTPPKADKKQHNGTDCSNPKRRKYCWNCCSMIVEIENTNYGVVVIAGVGVVVVLELILSIIFEIVCELIH
jgi:hypothetical protein